MAVNRLSWGCGPTVPDGWTGSDREDFGQEHVGDIRAGLPWPDGTFDTVVAIHSLQQLTVHDLSPALAELRRVTRPAGVLRVSVPDIIGAFMAWTHGDKVWFPLDPALGLGEMLTRYLTWYGTNLTPFTVESLASALSSAGWADIELVRPGFSRSDDPRIFDLDDRYGESIFAEGRA